MKVVLRVVGPLFIAVGLFRFAQGTGLLQGSHNAAMIDYGAGIVALGIGLVCRMAVGVRAQLGSRRVLLWTSLLHRPFARRRRGDRPWESRRLIILAWAVVRPEARARHRFSHSDGNVVASHAERT